MQPNFYKYLSLIKLIVWVLILFIDYVAINVFEDPVIAIWIMLIWCFLVAWWASFFFFQVTQKYLVKKNNTSFELESYRLSFLFGMYALLNIILILLWHRNKIWWLILLGVFIFLLYVLLLDTKNVKKSK